MKVLVIDDHVLFRDGIVSLLRAAGYDVVGEAGNGIDGIAKAEKLRPDLILLDISMPEMDGLETLRRIREKRPNVKIIMLTASDREADLLDTIRMGASGYLLKDLATDDFLKKLDDFQAGESPISKKMVSKLVGTFSSSESDEQSISDLGESPLTKREIEILKFMAKGLSNPEIAEQLHISRNTVKFHIKNILQKKMFTNRTEAATYAVKAGLLDENS